MKAKDALRLPFIAGLLGGGLVAAALLLTGVGRGGTTTTVFQQAPLTSSAAQRSTGLTPRQIYERDAPGVVFVSSQIVQRVQSPFDLFPQVQRGQATGSGLVVDHDGHILTNAHVIEGAVKVTVKLADQKVVDANVVGKDSSTDLALLKISPDGLNLHPLPLGSSHEVHVGDPTIAIGNPFGLDRTLTTGVVSALQRKIQAPNGFTISNVIQTDAPLNPGNSGGPLLDAGGRVIGINSQIETADGGATGGQGGSIGIGFAVPIDTAKQVVPQIEHGGSVQHAYLGLSSVTIDGSLASLNLPAKSGALVQSVEHGGPAEQAGIHGGDITANTSSGQIELGGDVITAVDGKSISSSDDLAGAIGGKRPGESVKLDTIRDGKHQTVTVTLGSRPNRQVQEPTPGG
ncbi:MAG: PDZ domain-containing protein [Actinobacteria bacterium]|nr:MAG: PDZ domain-containing protein [Actinomycetota bacterium]